MKPVRIFYKLLVLVLSCWPVRVGRCKLCVGLLQLWLHFVHVVVVRMSFLFYYIKQCLLMCTATLEVYFCTLGLWLFKSTPTPLDVDEMSRISGSFMQMAVITAVASWEGIRVSLLLLLALRVVEGDCNLCLGLPAPLKKSGRHSFQMAVENMWTTQGRNVN